MLGLLFIVIGIPIIILLTPYWIVIIPIDCYKKIKFEKKYKTFLIENHGKNFFCYNNRKNSQNFIEDNIIPNLNDKIDIVFLNGKIIETEFNSEFVSAALYKSKNYNRFPHLIKIRNGKLIDKSINNPFYNVLNLNKSQPELLNQINRFFDLS
ncbi:MAG: hypothetical protein DWP97_04405 [Calditrichaeota bacterium]|nr:MAG: hypothetical protein DWP97_04405 [Calditrichota bacterium]